MKRKPASKVYIRKRHLALDSNGQVRARQMKKLILVLIMLGNDEQLKMKEKARRFLRLAIPYYLLLTCMTEEEFKVPPSLPSTIYIWIDNWSESGCRLDFNFKQADLKDLLQLLRFPVEMVLDNGARMYDEEVFLRGLYELVTGERQQSICDKVFGRVQGDKSRATKAFLSMCSQISST